MPGSLTRHSQRKDILKLTTTLIANTKGDGKAGDEFWTKQRPCCIVL